MCMPDQSESQSITCVVSPTHCQPSAIHPLKHAGRYHPEHARTLAFIQHVPGESVRLVCMNHVSLHSSSRTCWAGHSRHNVMSRRVGKGFWGRQPQGFPPTSKEGWPSDKTTSVRLYWPNATNKFLPLCDDPVFCGKLQGKAAGGAVTSSHATFHEGGNRAARHRLELPHGSPRAGSTHPR